MTTCTVWVNSLEMHNDWSLCLVFYIMNSLTQNMTIVAQKCQWITCRLDLFKLKQIINYHSRRMLELWMSFLSSSKVLSSLCGDVNLCRIPTLHCLPYNVNESLSNLGGPWKQQRPATTRMVCNCLTNIPLNLGKLRIRLHSSLQVPNPCIYH